jgi:hypothetical protein
LDGGPVVIAVTDQAFPPCVLARTAKKEYIRVIKVEDDSLQDLTHALADAIGQGKLAKGSVIMIGSVTHMAHTGTEHYLTDWVRSRWWIEERFGEDKIVLPLAPILGEGLKDRSTVRTLVESLTWFTTLSATEAVLMKGTLTDYISRYFTCTNGEGWKPDRQCFRLPAGLDTKATVAIVSDGGGNWPDCIPPMLMAAEEIIVKNLLAKLNEAFDLDIDLDPCLARDMAGINEQRESDCTAKAIAILGNSNASRLGRALKNLGLSVISLIDSSWRLTKASVEEAVMKLATMAVWPCR